VALRGTDGDVLGILSVDGPSDGLRPSDAQIDGLVALAGMAALALGQAQEARRAAAQRVALDRLVQVSSRVAGERPAGDALAQVCAGISEALGFARVAVLLGDDGAALRPVATAGWTLDDPALDLGHTLADLAPLMGYEHERHGCYLVGHDEAGRLLSREHTAYRSQNNGRGPRAWDRHCLLAPLGTRDRRTRGVIWVEDPADRLLPGRDALQGLRLFADLAASVLDTSHASDVASHAAAHDPLTGLANRSTFGDRLRHAVQRTKRTPGAIAVLFIDLDRFKDLNDSLGHSAGDELLRVVASRIDADLRPGDTVARFGGDEFVALCEDLAGPEAAFDVAERVRSAVAQPIELAAGEVTITASIGIALPDRPDRTAEAILQAADRAMYEAKAAGRDSARLASPGAGWP
jgi:diguanylate cyclase (GGDEF)-like protein